LAGPGIAWCDQGGFTPIALNCQQQEASMHQIEYKWIALAGAFITCIGSAVVGMVAWGIAATMIAVGCVLFLAGVIGWFFNS
jgi:hypothetical protein